MSSPTCTVNNCDASVPLYGQRCGVHGDYATTNTPSPDDELQQAISTFIALKFDVDTDDFADGTLERYKNCLATILALIQTAEVQTALNMQVQWKQERINHTLSTEVKAWKTELNHFDEFSVKFIAELTKQAEVSL